MTCSWLRTTWARGVVIVVAGRSPVFMRSRSMVPPTARTRRAPAASGHGGGLRAHDERQERREELVRPFGHEQVAAAFDDAHFRLREHLFRIRDVADREDRILAAPDDQSWSGVARRLGDPVLAQRRLHAAQRDAAAHRADELRERPEAVTVDLLIELCGDPRRVEEACAQYVAALMTIAHEARERDHPR